MQYRAISASKGALTLIIAWIIIRTIEVFGPVRKVRRNILARHISIRGSNQVQNNDGGDRFVNGL